MAHSFRLDAANAANCTHRNTTGLPSTAATWAFAISFRISTFPASGKFLDVIGLRSQTASSPMSVGLEANNAGDFYYNREQGSPFTNITYTETIISTGGSTAFRRMFGTFGTNSQQIWTRSGGTSTQVINLTEALAFTVLRGLFAADEVFASDMGGVVDFDQIVLSTASQTQGNLETQSDTRSLTLGSPCFYNDCTGATSFITDGSGNGNTWTQTGATADVAADSWPAAASQLRPLRQQISIWSDPPPDAVKRTTGIAAFTASPQQFDTVIRPLRPQGLAQAMWSEPDAMPQRHVGIAAAVAAPSTALTGCRAAATAAIAWWSVWGAWSLQAQRPQPIAAVSSPPAAAATVPVTRDNAALSLWDGDSPWDRRRRTLVPVSNPPATDFVPRSPPRRSLWEDPVVPTAIRRPVAAVSRFVSTVFPFAISADSRYLVDVNGNPLPILGRASWNLLQETATKISDYLDDCVAKGFTAIETRAISSDGTTTGAVRATRAPFANNGALLPFSKKLNGANWNGDMPPTAFGSYPNINNDAPDFTTPVEAYWSFVDVMLTACLQRNLLVLFFPSYVGFASTNQGWMAEMVANGTTKINAYGQFVADRYHPSKFPNIVWMIGGDYGTGSNPFTQSQHDVEQALVDGIRDVINEGVLTFSAEWNSPAIFSDTFDETQNIVIGDASYLNGAYDFGGDINTTGRRAYADANGAVPSFGLEYPYDQEGSDGTNVNAAATQPVRRFSYWAWLSTIGGYMTGNGFVWPFDHTGGSDDWENHLNTTGAQDLARLNTLVKSVEWWRLVPSGLAGMRTLIPSGGGSGPSATDYIAAACAANGSFALAYVPPASGGTFTVDLRSMRPGVRARWFNPTTGGFTTNGSAAGTFTLSNTASAQSFTTPGNNGTGDTDWVLFLDTPDPPSPRRPGASLAALALWNPDPQAPLISNHRFVPTSNPPSADVVLRILDRQELWPEVQLQPRTRPGIAAVIATATPDTVLRPVKQQAALALLWSDSGLVPQPRRLLVLDAPADTVLRAPPQEQALALWTDPPLPFQRPLPIAAFTASVDSFPRPIPRQIVWPEPELRPQRPPGFAGILAAVADTVLRPASPTEQAPSDDLALPPPRRPAIAAILAVAATADTVPRPAMPAEQTTTAEDLAVPPIRRPAIAAITAPAAATPDTVISGRTGYDVALTWWQPEPLQAAPRRNLVVENAPIADAVLRSASRWLALQLIWTPETLPAPRSPGVAATTAVAQPDTVLRPLPQAATQALWNVAAFAPQRTVAIAAIADQPTPADVVLSTRRRTDLVALAWWSDPAPAPVPRRVLTPDSVDTVLRLPSRPPECPTPDFAPAARPGIAAVTAPAGDSVQRPCVRQRLDWEEESLSRQTLRFVAAITAPPPPLPDTFLTGPRRTDAALAWWKEEPVKPHPLQLLARANAPGGVVIGSGPTRGRIWRKP